MRKRPSGRRGERKRRRRRGYSRREARTRQRCHGGGRVKMQRRERGEGRRRRRIYGHSTINFTYIFAINASACLRSFSLSFALSFANVICKYLNFVCK